jgi:hypothetical protein
VVVFKKAGGPPGGSDVYPKSGFRFPSGPFDGTPGGLYGIEDAEVKGGIGRVLAPEPFDLADKGRGQHPHIFP